MRHYDEAPVNQALDPGQSAPEPREPNAAAASRIQPPGPPDSATPIAAVSWPAPIIALGGPRPAPWPWGRPSRARPRGHAPGGRGRGFPGGDPGLYLVWQMLAERRDVQTALRRRSARAGASSNRRWTRSSPWTRTSASCCSTGRRGGLPLAARQAIGAPLERFLPRALPRRARAHRQQLRRAPASPAGAWATSPRSVGAARRRRGVPDRGLDLAGRRGRAATSTP